MVQQAGEIRVSAGRLDQGTAIWSSEQSAGGIGNHDVRHGIDRTIFPTPVPAGYDGFRPGSGRWGSEAVDILLEMFDSDK
jgi:hypothetical protein